MEMLPLFLIVFYLVGIIWHTGTFKEDFKEYINRDRYRKVMVFYIIFWPVARFIIKP